MRSYKRKVEPKLYILRFMFACLLGLCFYFFKTGSPNFGYTVVVLITTIGFISVTGIEMKERQIIVRKYLMFGFIPFIKKFNLSSTEFSTFEIELESDEDAAMIDSGQWWDILLVLLPSPKLSMEMYVLKDIDDTGKLKETRIRLTPEEIKLISSIYSQKTT